MLSCHLSRYHGAVLQCMSLLRKMVSSSPVGASQAVLRMAAGERHEFLRSSSIARRDRRRLLRVNQSQSREVTARPLQCAMPGSTRSRAHQIAVDTRFIGPRHSARSEACCASAGGVVRAPPARQRPGTAHRHVGPTRLRGRQISSAVRKPRDCGVWRPLERAGTLDNDSGAL